MMKSIVADLKRIGTRTLVLGFKRWVALLSDEEDLLRA